MARLDEMPETRYARSGGGSVAYQVFGRGESTFIGLPPVVSNIEMIWDDPEARAFLRGIGAFACVVHFDKRGQGLSERFSGVPTLEERVEDLTAVMDAAGIERAVLGGISEGGLMAAYFAATHPERVQALVLASTFARVAFADDYPDGLPLEVVDELVGQWESVWGTPQTLTVAMMVSSKLGDPAFLRWVNRYERGSATPAAFAEALRLDARLDIREVLPQIRVPTVVIHRSGDPLVPVAHGRYVAERIPGAKFVELSGSDHVPWWGDTSSEVLAEIEEIVTGRRTVDPSERILATVLFTDIVRSTERAAAVGDRKWTQLLNEMDGIVARHVVGARGRIIKSTGDGHLATFDGPARAVRAAEAVGQEVNERLGLQLRAGLHSGEVELRGEDIGGIAVHIAARVSALAGPGQVLVSRTVTDLVAGSGLSFSDVGLHDLKGVPGSWQIYSLVSAN